MRAPPPAGASACPLCGGANGCAPAAGAGECWCFSARVPREVLDRVPDADRGRACVCARCAAGVPAPERTFPSAAG